MPDPNLVSIAVVYPFSSGRLRSPIFLSSFASKRAHRLLVLQISIAQPMRSDMKDIHLQSKPHMSLRSHIAEEVCQGFRLASDSGPSGLALQAEPRELNLEVPRKP